MGQRGSTLTTTYCKVAADPFDKPLTPREATSTWKQNCAGASKISESTSKA